MQSKMIRAIVAGTALAALVGSAGANANPISFYYSTDGNNYVQFGTTVDGANSATVVVPLGQSSTTITATAFAPPVLPSPGLQTSYIGITAPAAETIYVAVIENGVSTPTITGFGINFGNGSTSTVDALQAAAKVIDGNSTVLAYKNLSPTNSSTVLIPTGGLPAVYGLAEVFVASFGSSGGRLDANISIFGVPEPMSIALLTVGLAGVACVRHRRRQA